MADIVILGAGIGGLPMAYDMRKQARPEDNVIVVSNVDYFHFVPSNPWVAVNWRKRDDIQFPLAPYLEKKGIEFIATGAKRLHPAGEPARAVDGALAALRLPRDRHRAEARVRRGRRAGARTAIRSRSATSTTPSPRARPGRTSSRIPGPIVVGAVQGASCYGPAYEFAMIMDTDLRRRKIRDKRADDLRDRRAVHRAPGARAASAIRRD